MDALDSECPPFMQELRNLSQNPEFLAFAQRVSQQAPGARKKVIFISRAWPYDDDRLHVNEEWSDELARFLYEHLQLLGFEPILDKKDLAVGRQLDSAMKKSIDTADHVLLLITKTYLHKVLKDPFSGVAKEFQYLKQRIELMDPNRVNGAEIAGERRFVIPFALTDNLAGLPLADGHSGFAAIYVSQVGYHKALVDLGEKLLNGNVGADMMSRGIFSAVSPRFHRLHITEPETDILASQEELIKRIRKHKLALVDACKQNNESWYGRVDSKVVMATAILGGAVLGAAGFAWGPVGFLTVPLGGIAGAMLGNVFLFLFIYVLKEYLSSIHVNEFASFLDNNEAHGALFCYLMGIILCQKADEPFSKDALEQYLLNAINDSRTYFNSKYVDDLMNKSEEAYASFLENKATIMDALEARALTSEQKIAKGDLNISVVLHDQAKNLREELLQTQLKRNTMSASSKK